MGCNVERPIDSSYFTSIPRIREFIKTLPEQIRTCSNCGKEVTLSPERDFSENPGAGPPFAEVAFIGCDEAINRVKAATGM
jgi:hypothetical protein